MGIICRSKHVGVHELCVKVGSCFVKIQEGRRASWPRAPQTMGQIDSKQAHCPQRFTTCRLTCRPSRLALAGSYPKVPEVRSDWLTKGGRWSRALLIPRLNCALASQPEPPSTRQPMLTSTVVQESTFRSGTEPGSR